MSEPDVPFSAHIENAEFCKASISNANVHSLSFYIRLAGNVLSNVRDQLLVHDIDPFSLYTFGSSWIRELNAGD